MVMDQGKRVVFVCGCSRSGTTLLGSLLGNAPNCITTPESQFVIETAVKILRGEIQSTFEDIRNTLAKNFRLKLWGLERKIEHINDPGGNDILVSLVWKCIDLYAESIKKNGSLNVWIDHTPDSIKYITILTKFFPNSYFIHIVRDGRGVFSSIKPLDFGPNGVIRGALWWGYRVAPGLAAEQVFNKRIMRVRFEDLLTEPEKELKKICNFTDIPFDSTMLRGEGFVVPKYTKSQHKLVGLAPDETVCEKWKHNLSPREIEIFESLSGSLLEYLQYELIYGLTAKPPNRRERFREALCAQPIRKILNIWHNYYRRKIVLPL